MTHADDVAALLDHLGWPRAVIGGAGLGSTIALRTAVAYAERVEALILAPAGLSASLRDAEDFARAFAPPIRDFLRPFFKA